MTETRLVPVPVIVECAWQIETNVSPAAEVLFLGAVNRGELARVDLTAED